MYTPAGAAQPGNLVMQFAGESDRESRLRPLWQFLTDFGDTAVTVPFAVLVLGFLLAARERRLALGWGLVIFGAASAMAALKLASTVCGYPFAGAGLASPSGHSAMSIAVYGGFAAIAGFSLRPPARAALIGTTAILVTGITASRAIEGYHTKVEVAIGLAVGLGALGAMIAIAVRHRARRLPLAWLAAGALVVFALFHGTRWPAERAIHRLAWWLDILRPLCR